MQRVSKASSCSRQISIQIFLVTVVLKGFSCSVPLNGLMVWCWLLRTQLPLPVPAVSVTVSRLCTNLRDCDLGKSIICFSSITFCRAKSPPLWILFIVANKAFTNPSLLKETEDWHVPSDIKLEGISYIL